MLVDICASIVSGEPIARSKELFDKIYDENDGEYERVRREFNQYGQDRLIEEVKVTLSVLKEIIDGYSLDPNALRSVVNPKSANPIKAPLKNWILHQQISPEEQVLTLTKGAAGLS